MIYSAELERLLVKIETLELQDADMARSVVAMSHNQEVTPSQLTLLLTALQFNRSTLESVRRMVQNFAIH